MRVDALAPEQGAEDEDREIACGMFLAVVVWWAGWRRGPRWPPVGVAVADRVFCFF